MRSERAERGLSGGAKAGAAVPPLLCDEMLQGMARWLRAAGYDTALAEPGTPDEAVLALREADRRLLLTCDRRLAAAAGPRDALVLRGNASDDWAAELTRRLGVEWLAAPFTRCLLDNRPLRPARAEERLRLPERLRSAGSPATACDACGRIYWPGGHVRRMTERLARWHALIRQGDAGKGWENRESGGGDGIRTHDRRLNL